MHFNVIVYICFYTECVGDDWFGDDCWMQPMHFISMPRKSDKSGMTMLERVGRSSYITSTLDSAFRRSDFLPTMHINVQTSAWLSDLSWSVIPFISEFI